MDIWTIIGVIAAVTGVASAWFFYIRSRQTAGKNIGDGSVDVDKHAEVGNIKTKVEKSGDTFSSGDGSVDIGQKSKVGDISTDVSKTHGSDK